MDLAALQQLTLNQECGHIEFKREWYWNTNEKASEKSEIQKKWGEFIKDILAITNANRLCCTKLFLKASSVI